MGRVLPEHAHASKLVRRVGMRIARTASESPGSGFVQHMQASPRLPRCNRQCQLCLSRP